MNTRIFFTLFISVLLFSSCASLRRGTSRFDESKSPNVQERPGTIQRPEPVTVREERVRAVDHVGTETIFRYYVILGSFQVIDNARNFRTQLTAEQFIPAILESDIGFFRVSVGAFNDEAAARDRIRQIRLNHPKYSDVWLLMRKR